MTSERVVVSSTAGVPQPEPSHVTAPTSSSNGISPSHVPANGAIAGAGHARIRLSTSSLPMRDDSWGRTTNTSPEIWASKASTIDGEGIVPPHQMVEPGDEQGASPPGQTLLFDHSGEVLVALEEPVVEAVGIGLIARRRWDSGRYAPVDRWITQQHAELILGRHCALTRRTTSKKAR